MRDHSARVYRLSYRLTGNAHDAEDLTQDVFVRVFRSLHRFQPGTFEGWLHRITTNLFLDGARRRQKIRFDGLAEGSDDRLASSWPNPSQQLDDADLDHDVAAALNALAPTFRAAVVLCDIEGLTYEEISEVLDLKIGTVRSRIHRGRAQLRAALAHRRPTLEHTRYLGVDAEPGRSTDRRRRRRSTDGCTRSPGERHVSSACDDLAELRSGFVDGALSAAGPRARRRRTCSAAPAAVPTSPSCGPSATSSAAAPAGHRPGPALGPSGLHRRRRLRPPVDQGLRRLARPLACPRTVAAARVRALLGHARRRRGPRPRSG